MNKVRTMSAILTLTASAALGSIALAQEVRTGEALGVGYSLYDPVAVDSIPFGEVGERVVFAAPPGAELTWVTRDDEDLITAIETEAGLEEVAAFYDDLFEAQEDVELVTEQVVREGYATALYRYNDVLFRWTAELVRPGVYRVAYNFEPAEAVAATGAAETAAVPTGDAALAGYDAGDVRYELYGPTELNGLQAGNIVRLAVPQGDAVEVVEAERVEDGLRVKFVTPAELERVYGYYRDLLQQQGFEVVEDEPVEDDKIRAVFERGENDLVLTIEREGDEQDLYSVLFSFTEE